MVLKRLVFPRLGGIGHGTLTEPGGVLKDVLFPRLAGIGHRTLTEPGGVCTGTTASAGKDSHDRQGSLGSDDRISERTGITNVFPISSWNKVGISEKILSFVRVSACDPDE